MHVYPVTGYYIMGKYTSCAWYAKKADAEAECKRMNYCGNTCYRVEESRVEDDKEEK